MRKFMGLTKRNLLIYFKDIQSVVFSLLTSIIVFVLYLLFLKSSFVDSIEASMQGLENLIDRADIEMFVNGFLLSGILGSAMITVPYNCLGTIVKDKENKIDYDVSVTPMKRGQIVLSYFTAAAISAFLMTTLIMLVGVLILSLQGDLYLGIRELLELLGITFLGAVSSTALFMLVVLFFQNASASSAFFGILSAAAGFVIGAYIPISQFSEGVQTFCNIFPGTGVTVLYRNVLLNGVLDHIDASIGGVDEGMFVESMKEFFAFQTKLFGNELDRNVVAIYVGAFTVLCIVLMVLIYPRVYKRK